MKTFRIEVYGRVQGVFFRKTAKKLADEFEIKGTVKNQDDGSVVILAQGKDEQLEIFLRKIKSHPGMSRVENTKLEEIKTNDKFDDFRIIYEDSFLDDKKKSFKNLGRNFL